MATYFFGVNNGAGVVDGTAVGATTTGKDIEIVINTTANVPSVEELLLGVEKLEAFIVQNGKAW